MYDLFAWMFVELDRQHLDNFPRGAVTLVSGPGCGARGGGGGSGVEVV